MPTRTEVAELSAQAAALISETVARLRQGEVSLSQAEEDLARAHAAIAQSLWLLRSEMYLSTGAPNMVDPEWDADSGFSKLPSSDGEGAGGR